MLSMYWETTENSVDGALETDSIATCSVELSEDSTSKMDIACVLDLQQSENLFHRQKAFEEAKNACDRVRAKFHHIEFEKLDCGDTNVLDTFYNADIAVIDLSIQLQRSALFYHLGVRESFGMKENILLYNGLDSKATIRLKLSCGSYTLVPYDFEDAKVCLSRSTVDKPINDELISLSDKLKKLYEEVEVQSK
ncbi:PREDICTED: mitogen-activated protein kinase kinase kinase 5-like [Ceratosolen solmsi marchali]|uniref:Mitogen-activated protein kinase kinase kinase 5-like n=1 Tax=Ceratosolen solmsi marchali TaxID=326594 RepID=A0AAJ6YHE8_9HYME|nr:PREDICTED: mitogen-activated protein kinase kinase kinase 5-like [Ceratosolen solmsi marchali]